MAAEVVVPEDYGFTPDGVHWVVAMGMATPAEVRKDQYEGRKRARKAIRQALNLERQGKWLEAEEVLFQVELVAAYEYGGAEIEEATTGLRARYHAAGRLCDMEQEGSPAA